MISEKYLYLSNLLIYNYETFCQYLKMIFLTLNGHEILNNQWNNALKFVIHIFSTYNFEINLSVLLLMKIFVNDAGLKEL